MSFRNNISVDNPNLGLEIIPIEASRINDLAQMNCVIKENDRALLRLFEKYIIKI